MELKASEYWGNIETFAREQKDIYNIIGALIQVKNYLGKTEISEPTIDNPYFFSKKSFNIPVSRTGIAEFLRLFETNYNFLDVFQHYCSTLFHIFINFGNDGLAELLFEAEDVRICYEDLFTQSDRELDVTLPLSEIGKKINLSKVKFNLVSARMLHGEFEIGVPSSDRFLLKPIYGNLLSDPAVDYGDCLMNGPRLCLDGQSVDDTLKRTFSVTELLSKADARASKFLEDTGKKLNFTK